MITIGATTLAFRGNVFAKPEGAPPIVEAVIVNGSDNPVPVERNVSATVATHLK